MMKLIETGMDVLKEGLDSLQNIKKDKQAYRAYVARIKALPEGYQFVYKKASEYMWSFSGGGNGYDMISLQEGMLELFETSAAEGKGVVEVTGQDVAAFCDALLKHAKTYTEIRGEKLNHDIAKKIKGSTAP